MNDPQIVAALRAKAPDALASLFDCYGERLFRYCWFMLRNREIAQIAVRDALVAAEARITTLADPQGFGPWLYALARSECQRRRAVPAAEADEPPARPSQPDAGSRLMAWNAVMSMEPDEREALHLVCVHDLDVGLALGIGAQETWALLARARHSLEQSLGAEIWISRGSHACPDRAEVLRGWAGVLTPRLRDRVLRHAATCPVCEPALPRNVSAARVFALLPSPALPPDARTAVLGFHGDLDMAAYREFAVSRAVPAAPGAAEPATASRGAVGASERRGRRWRPWAPRVPRRPRRRASVLPIGVVTLTMAAAAVAAGFIVVGRPGAPVSPGRAGRTVPTAMAGSPTAPRRSGAGSSGAVRVGAQPAPAPGLTLPPAGGDGQATMTSVLTGLPTLPDPGLPESWLPSAGPPVPRPSPPAPSVNLSAGLAVTPSRLNLSASPSVPSNPSTPYGLITITAQRRAVTWSAVTSSFSILIGNPGGTLQAGRAATVTVRLSQAAPGSGSALIGIEPGAISVRVTWSSGPGTAPPSPPGPTRRPVPWRPHPRHSPSPSPTDSVPPPSSPPTSDPSPSPPQGSTPPVPAGSPSAPGSASPSSTRAPRGSRPRPGRLPRPAAGYLEP